MHWAPLLNNGIPFTAAVDHLALVYLIAAPPGKRKDHDDDTELAGI
jgi:hypothetical protein